METFKYKLFSLYIPTILAFTSFVLTATALAGQTSKHKSSAEVYLLKIDFTNIHYDQVLKPINETLYDMVSLKNYYTIGFWGYCETNWKDYDDLFYCKTGNTAAFKYDLYDIIEKDGLRYRNIRPYVHYIALPYGIGIWKIHVNVMYAAIWIAVVANGLLMASYFFSSFYNVEKPHAFLPFLTILAAGFSALCAGLAHGLYSRIIKNYTKQYDRFGIKASFGNSKLYGLIWAAVSLQLMSFIMVLFANYQLAKYKAKQEKSNENVTTSTILTPQAPQPSPASVVRSIEIEAVNETNASTPADHNDLPPRYEDINKHRPPKPPSFRSATTNRALHRPNPHY